MKEAKVVNPDKIADEIARRTAAELATVYRPSADDVTAAWKRHIAAVLSERDLPRATISDG